MKVKMLAALGAALVACAPGEAATITQSFDWSNSFGGGSIYYFDGRIGNLTSVDLSYTAVDTPIYNVFFTNGSTSITATAVVDVTPHILGYSGNRITGSRTVTITPADLFANTYAFPGVSQTVNLSLTTAVDLAKFTTNATLLGPVDLFPNQFGLPTVNSGSGFFTFPGRSTPLRLNGTIVYNYDPLAAVPEPATWAMMVGGFGVVGAAMRHRRRGKQVTA